MAVEKKYVKYAMRMIRQLSVFGNRLTYVNFSIKDAPIPTKIPMSKLPKNTPKNIPIASNRLRMLKDISGDLYFWAVSKRTIAIASFKMDSPNITVYNFGSTLYVLNMARIVTGSVAESVAPTDIASTNEILSPSRGILVQRNRIRPSTNADMNVPAKAKVRMVPI
jgi:hypothetical protein